MKIPGFPAAGAAEWERVQHLKKRYRVGSSFDIISLGFQTPCEEVIGLPQMPSQQAFGRVGFLVKLHRPHTSFHLQKVAEEGKSPAISGKSMLVKYDILGRYLLGVASS